jgi:hypothetical protein
VGRACGTLGRGQESVHTRFCGGKPEGKRPFGRLRHRWEDGTRIDLREIGWGRGRMDSVGSG